MVSIFDAAVGGWLEDSSYFFIEGEDVQNCNRYYFLSNSTLEKVRQKCDGWVKNYYKSETTPSLDRKTHYIQGRHYYGQKKLIKNNIITSRIRSLPIINQLEPYTGQKFHLYSIMCSRLTKDKPKTEVELIERLSKCPPLSDCDPCTKIGGKIAKNLIRVAALRIFAEPEQSILELPVNSIDAYNPESKVGKFGMGFFSFLYWLVGHSKRKLEITSFYKHKQGYATYKVTIQEVNNSLTFSLDPYLNSQVTKTGTFILLDCRLDKFNENELKSFGTQLNKLFNVSGKIVKLNMFIGKDSNFFSTENITYQKKIHVKNRFPLNNKEIYCSLNKNYISIEDYATGIPLDVLLNSMFIPSISTKTIKLSNENKSKYVINSTCFQMFFGDNGVNYPENTLSIVVNGISVVNITSGNENSYSPRFFILDLPPYTSIPVSRDDIILTPNIIPIFKESINMVLNHAIDSKWLNIIQNLLVKYITYTSNYENKELVRKTIDEFQRKNIHRLVPENYINYYNKLSTKEIKFISSRIYDRIILEKTVSKIVKADKGIWEGMNVVFGDFPKDITNAGLNTYLFINQKYKESLGKDWINIITNSFMKTKLFPISSKKEKMKRFILFTRENRKMEDLLSKRLYQQYLIVIKRYLSMEPYFKIKYDISRFQMFFHRVMPILQKEYQNDIINTLLTKFSTFKGNQTYGGSKFNLNILSIPELKIKYIHSVMNDSILTYSLIYQIQGTEEDNCTIIHLYPKLFEEIHKTRIKKEGTYGIGYNYFSGIEIKNNNEIGRKILKNIFSVTSDPKEYIILARVVYYLIKNDYLSPEINLTKVLQNILPDIRDTYLTDDIMMQNINLFRLTFFILKLANKAIVFINFFSQNKNKIPKSSLPNFNCQMKFKISQLLGYLFENNIKDPGYGWLNELSNYSPKESSLQIIGIAINEGTTKNYINASITELIQNSVDAIRSTKSKNKNIDIKVKKIGEKIAFKIIDKVGMNVENFISLSIPFLSSKTPSELVTGEMGSGFFNVYSKAYKVIIKTKKDKKKLTSVETPIKDKSERVIDVLKEVCLEHDDSPGGYSSITVIVNESNEDTVSDITFYSKNVMSIIDPSISKIFLNDTLISQNRFLSVDLDNLIEFAIIGNPTSDFSNVLKFYESNPYTNSYILTNNIPFGNLEDYISESLSTIITKKSEIEVVKTLLTNNVVINFKQKGYNPVQSRTKIRLNPEILPQFQESIKMAIYIKALIQPNFHRNNIDHYSSSVSINFIGHMTKNDNNNYSFSNVPELLLWYRFQGLPNLATLINKGIDYLIKHNTSIRKMSKIQFQDFKKYYNDIFGNKSLVSEMLFQVVSGWLENKSSPVDFNTSGRVVINKDNTVKNLKKDEEVFYKDENLQPLIEKWVNTYFEMASSLRVVGFVGRKPPKVIVRISSKNSSVLGFYNPNEHSITINTTHLTDTDRKKIINAFNKKNIQQLQSSKVNKINKMFSYTFPSCTLAHELEHARRRDSHKGIHSSINTVILPNEDKKVRSFDQSANAVYKFLLSHGLYEKMF